MFLFGFVTGCLVDIPFSRIFARQDMVHIVDPLAVFGKDACDDFPCGQIYARQFACTEENVVAVTRETAIGYALPCCGIGAVQYCAVKKYIAVIRCIYI